MKRQKRPTIVILYNLILIAIFFVVYYVARHHFVNEANSEPELIDIFNLSVTIQTAVGVSSFMPKTNVGKIILIIQQILLLFGNLIILHFMIV
jgi:hypothetical protein